MTITAGIHFTENYIRIVFMNRCFKAVESIKENNNPKGFLVLKKYLLKKYPPADIKIILDQANFYSHTFPKILLNHGYTFALIPSIIFYDPVFNLLMALPKKSRFYRAFIKAAMLWIPLFKVRLLIIKKKEYDNTQLTLF